MTQLKLFEDKNNKQNQVSFNVLEEDFITKQLITYIGNKRKLLDYIGSAVNEIRNELNKNKLSIIDLFSGSGVVSRYLKRFSSKIIANDFEDYSYTLNRCYLTNKEDIDLKEILKYYQILNEKIDENNLRKGFISELYAPYDDSNIKKGERVFFTTRNAMYIDTVRQLIDEYVPNHLKIYFIAPLLTEVSIKNNTSGVFKGFYKNSKTGIGYFGGQNGDALQRIKAPIELKLPVFSNYTSEVEVYKRDANELIKEVDEVDLIYLDPPYNQHPYGSNYFMLNLVNSYSKPEEISDVSGIPKVWKRSNYNKRKHALDSFRSLCENAKAKYLLISFNSEGFISLEQMITMLSTIGDVRVMEKEYNTFRGARNLRNRPIHVKEYLYLVKKY